MKDFWKESVIMEATKKTLAEAAPGLLLFG
jgi:hypothetical protein